MLRTICLLMLCHLTVCRLVRRGDMRTAHRQIHDGGVLTLDAAGQPFLAICQHAEYTQRCMIAAPTPTGWM